MSAPGQQWSRLLDAETDAGAAPASHLQVLGIPKLEGWEPGRVWMQWAVDASVQTPMGPVFGGYIAALADHVMACALFTVLEDGEMFSTTDLHTSFLRAIRGGGVVTLEAVVVSRSERTASCEVWFKDSARRPLARAVAKQAIRPANGRRVEAR